jgi:hypothetical protein
VRLIPGRCDPTVNLYDWHVCIRGGRVEQLWPITARGAVYWRFSAAATKTPFRKSKECFSLLQTNRGLVHCNVFGRTHRP